MGIIRTGCKSLSILVLCIVTASCFHLRRTSDFPATLHTMYLTTSNVSSSISTALKRELVASGVHLTHSPNHAPLTLTLYNSRNSVDMPVAFNNTAATSYTYQMIVHVKLVTLNHKQIIDTPVFVSQPVVHNVNQVDSPVITPLMRRTLTRRIVENILDLLTSVNTQKQLTQHLTHK